MPSHSGVHNDCIQFIALAAQREMYTHFLQSNLTVSNNAGPKEAALHWRNSGDVQDLEYTFEFEKVVGSNLVSKNDCLESQFW